MTDDNACMGKLNSVVSALGMTDISGSIADELMTALKTRLSKTTDRINDLKALIEKAEGDSDSSLDAQVPVPTSVESLLEETRRMIGEKSEKDRDGLVCGMVLAGWCIEDKEGYVLNPNLPEGLRSQLETVMTILHELEEGKERATVHVDEQSRLHNDSGSDEVETTGPDDECKRGPTGIAATRVRPTR